MKHTSRNNPAIGKPVIAMETSTRRLAIDFPGWDHPDHLAYLMEIPLGLAGEIVEVELHGSNPWTRYTVTFHDGTRASGLIIGRDIRLDQMARR